MDAGRLLSNPPRAAGRAAGFDTSMVVGLNLQVAVSKENCDKPVRSAADVRSAYIATGEAITVPSVLCTALKPFRGLEAWRRQLWILRPPRSRS